LASCSIQELKLVSEPQKPMPPQSTGPAEQQAEEQAAQQIGQQQMGEVPAQQGAGDGASGHQGKIE
jgi:hypothetical protein